MEKCRGVPAASIDTIYCKPPMNFLAINAMHSDSLSFITMEIKRSISRAPTRYTEIAGEMVRRKVNLGIRAHDLQKDGKYNRKRRARDRDE